MRVDLDFGFKVKEFIMANRKYLPLVMVVLPAIVLFTVSCDSEQQPDNSGLLAKYAGKISVPSPGDLPGFTAEMGIPVRDSIEAEMLLDTMLIGTDYEMKSIFIDVGEKIRDGFIRHIEKKGKLSDSLIIFENEAVEGTYFGFPFYCIDYYYNCPERPGDFIESSKIRFDHNVNYSYSGITIYEGSLRNNWDLNRREIDSRDDNFSVYRSSCGFTLSQGGYCAKIILEYTYFYYGDYPGEGSVRVYGDSDQKLFEKKLTRRSDFRNYY